MQSDDEGSKTCTLCHETKPLSEFFWSRSRKLQKPYRHSRCKDCRRAQCRAWSRTEGGRAVKRNGILRREYRLSPSEFDALLKAQGGACAICRFPETKIHRDGSVTRLSVDHDHETGAVRGLLCSGCNVGLGSFADDPEALRAAVDYVERHRKKARRAA